MANVKFSELPIATDIALSDGIPFVKDLDGTPVTSLMTFSKFLENTPLVNFGTISVTDYGAVPDTKRLIDVVTTSGSATVTSASASFTSEDVGKEVFIAEIGITYPVFQGTISSVSDANTVILSGVASSSRSEGEAIILYGTDYATELQAALDAAGALLTNEDIGPNQPLGMGSARVIFPTTEAGSCYMFKTTLNVPDKVTIHADAVLFSNCGTAGDNNRTYGLTLGLGSNIESLVLQSNYSQGILAGVNLKQISSFIQNLQIWGVGRNFNAAFVGNEGQTALKLFGYDWRINFLWVKGGHNGFRLENASDVMLNNALLIGCNYPLIMKDCEEVNLNIRHDTPILGSGRIDRCSKVKLNLTEFIILNDGFVADEGLWIGNDSAGTPNQEIELNYSITRRGGTGIRLANTRNFKCNLIIENNQPIHQTGPGVATSPAVLYQSGLTGPIHIDCLLSSTVTPYAGTPVGTMNLNGKELLFIDYDKEGNGTTQATAAELTLSHTLTLFGADEADNAYKLPATAPVGTRLYFKNGGATDVQLFPPLGGNVDFGTEDASIVVSPFESKTLIKRFADNTWITL